MKKIKNKKIRNILLAKTVIVLLLLAILANCYKADTIYKGSIIVEQLELFSEKQEYFKLRDFYIKNRELLQRKDKLYFSAIINNVFNMAYESNLDIDKLLKSSINSLSNKKANKLYLIKLLNHVNLYEYSKAEQSSAYILQHFRDLNKDSKIEDLENEIKIWRALSPVGKQEVIKTQDTTIPMVKDKVGLFNVNVNFGKLTKQFLFDTGANFSVITQSLVKELGLKCIEADFYVTAATGAKVKSGIAIAEELKLQNIVFKNVVFLVFDDKDLAFPQAEYYPNGALGYPLLEAMDELRISQDNYIFTPKTPTVYNYNNFALDGLMPIVAVEYDNDFLNFHLDTGATSTTLFPQFLNDYQKEIESKFSVKKFKSASAGGAIEYAGYLIDTLPLKIADSQVDLKDITLHINDIGDSKSNFHGNLGQDYIKSFNLLILSFKYSSVLFE